MKFYALFAVILLLFYACSFRHIGCTSLCNGEQVEMMKYVGKGIYEVRPINDTEKVFRVSEDELK